MRPRIHLVVERPDGRRSDVEITSPIPVAAMDAAEDLLHALTYGERALPRDLYDLCALAFSTTRDDAKERLLAALYGAKPRAKETP